jgi:hypothetical protein
MKNLKLINLSQNALNQIKGGEEGGGGTTPACSCTCSCSGEDTTYNMNRSTTTSATNHSTMNSLANLK